MVKTGPLVSVIVPAYRVTKYVGETLDSVLAQTLQDFEIVVVNDGCPDTAALESVLEPYHSRLIYVKQENQGLAAARNTGILSGSPTKYVAFLDGDDKWTPDYLEMQVSAMERDPGVDVMYCDAIMFRDGGQIEGTFMEMCPSSGEVTFLSLIEPTCTVMVSVIARRETVVKAGMFDPNLRSSEDFDLWLRIVKGGGRISYQRRPLVHYRRRPESLSADRQKMYGSCLAVMQKALGRTDLSDGERSALTRRVVHIGAERSWDRGVQALSLGDTKAALDCLSDANKVNGSVGGSLLLVALRLAPWAAAPLYRMKRRPTGG